MKPGSRRSVRLGAASLAAAGLLLVGSAHSGAIRDANTDTTAGAFMGDCGTPGSPVACVGAWKLDNVDVELVRVSDGSTFGSFHKTSGVYTTMAAGDSFVSLIRAGVVDPVTLVDPVMAKLTGKAWPIGEPTGIKAVTGDTQVGHGKPPNCLISSAFLSPADSGNPATAFLDSAHPQPVICSSPFQSHKRFKIAMQAATVAGVANGAQGRAVDLVFNVADNGALMPYQVFSKLHNYTGKRLKGYRIVVGRGVGAGFQSAGALGIADRLHISLGLGEGAAAMGGGLDGSNLFEEDGLATFSHGLFGAPDKHFTSNGFFDSRAAGFNVEQSCSEGVCSSYPNPFAGGAPLLNSDTFAATTALPSNYHGPAAAPLSAPLFGDWLPGNWQPRGIFFDADGDPATDPDVVAWWDGAAWRKNYDAAFAPVSGTEFNAWAADSRYAVADIEDVVNLGVNYIVKVGDDIDNDPMTTGADFTIRIIPVLADVQEVPAYVSTTPTPLVATPAAPGAGSGGGCAAAVRRRAAGCRRIPRCWPGRCWRCTVSAVAASGAGREPSVFSAPSG